MSHFLLKRLLCQIHVSPMTSQAITGACLEIQCTSHAILGACHFIQSANHGIPAKQCVPLPFQFIKYACKIIQCTFQAISLNFQATCTLCDPKSSHESPIPFRAPQLSQDHSSYLAVYSS